MLPAPVPAVQKQHIGALGPHHLHAGEVGVDKIAGVAQVAVYHGDHFVGPFCPLGTERAHEGVDGEHVAVVIMAQPALGHHPVPEIFVVDDVVGAHQPRQREGLAGGVEGDGALSGVGRDALGGDVPVAGHNDVGPDFVGDHQAVIGGVDLHGLLDLPPLPHSAAGVVGGAEDGDMDAVFFQLPVHVLIVHTPDACLVPLQRGVHRHPAGILKGVGEAHIGGGVDKNLLSRRGEGLQRGADPAQHTVFIADVLRQQALHAVALSLPADDAGKVFLRQGEIAEVGHFQPLVKGLHHRRRGDKAHIRDPHGDGGKARVYRKTLKGDFVGGQGVFPPPVKNGGKIVFHGWFFFPWQGVRRFSSGNPAASWSGWGGAASAGPWPRSGGCAPG